MKRSLRVLMLEDNPDDAELLLRELLRAGFDPQATRVETEAAFLSELASSPEIILSDYSLPRFSGLQAAQLLRESGRNIPFILISGTVGEDVAVEAMKHGATDYLLKDRIARLGPAVERALEQQRLREEQKAADEEIHNQLHELQRWHEVMLGREERILQLKREVNAVLGQYEQPPRYAETAPG